MVASHLIQEQLHWNWLGQTQRWSSYRDGCLRFDCIDPYSQVSKMDKIIMNQKNHHIMC